MSIYGTILDFDQDDHRPDCATEVAPGIFDIGASVGIGDGPACSCAAMLEGPIVYRGSHLIPERLDRGGSFSLAECGRLDYLRVTLVKHGDAEPIDVVLDRAQVTEVRDAVTAWINARNRA